MRIVMVLTLWLAGAMAAAASGGFWCNVDDASMKFIVQGGITRGGGGGFFNVRSELASRLKSTAQLHTLRLTGAHLMHHWIDDKELKLVLYWVRSSPHFASAKILIQTKTTDEGKYAGRYELTIENSESNQASDLKTSQASGDITCGAD